MPPRESTDFSKRFLQQLERTRARIETLPEPWRPYFRSLADQAESHHRCMEEDCVKVRDLVDDMRLNEASVKFEIWATAQSLRRRLVSGRTAATGGTRSCTPRGESPPATPADSDTCG